MTAVDLIMGLCTALAAIVGFVFEWRRQSSVGELSGRVDGIDQRLAVVEQWRDRIGRSW